MDKKTGLNLGYAVFALLAVLLVRGEGNSGSPPAFYTLGAVSVGLQIGGQAAEAVILGASVEGSVLDVRDTLNHADYGKSVTPADMLVRGSVANKQADALRAAVAAAAR